MNRPAAFVLAAGVGTRLRPLTDILPKPLVPVFHKPLLTFALDSLLAAGAGVLALNTHHLPGAFTQYFGENPAYRGHSLELFHEPLLLDTGGGIRNASSVLNGGTFLLHNGDILADLPLSDLLAAHRTSGALATLMLRESGGRANVRFDASTGRVLDLRGELGVMGGVLAVYTGIAVFEPAIFNWIAEKGPSSLIDSLLLAMRAGEKIGGVLSREGLWLDLGTPSAYLEAHRLLSDPIRRPSHSSDSGWPRAIHPEARIDSGAVLEGMVVAGAGVTVEKGAFLRDSILWPGAVVKADSRVEECIVSGEKPVGGTHQGVVL